MDMHSPPPVPIGRRRASRLRIRRGAPAQLMTLDGQLAASLLDISETGAHVRCNHPLRRGQDAMLWWLGFEAFGKVVWTSDREGGLQFYDPLPQAILIKTRQEVDLGRVPTPDDVATVHARDWFFGHR